MNTVSQKFVAAVIHVISRKKYRFNLHASYIVRCKA